MSFTATMGIGQGFDGREAAQQAARLALDQIGKIPPVLAFVIASHEFSSQAVVSGISSILSTGTLWGMSTSQPIAGTTCRSRSVVVILLAGTDINAQAAIWPDSGQDNPVVAESLVKTLCAEKYTPSLVLLAADGLAGDVNGVCALIKKNGPREIKTAGCLAYGDPQFQDTFVIGGAQAAKQSLAALWLSGNISLGVGAGHGWQPVGAFFRATTSADLRLSELDGKPAIEIYSQWLGHPVAEWLRPPFSDLIRLYPLGIEKENDPGLEICSPLHANPDGSIQLSNPVPEGSMVHLMAGSQQACLNAATDAAQRALADLKSARPIFALVLVDSAWQMLMGPLGNPEMMSIQSVLGESVVIGGAFTPGQICSKDPLHPEKVLNQHIVVLLFGEHALQYH